MCLEVCIFHYYRLALFLPSHSCTSKTWARSFLVPSHLRPSVSSCCNFPFSTEKYYFGARRSGQEYRPGNRLSLRSSYRSHPFPFPFSFSFFIYITLSYLYKARSFFLAPWLIVQHLPSRDTGAFQFRFIKEATAIPCVTGRRCHAPIEWITLYIIP